MANRSLLFTPGPLTTSRTVKETMLADFGSRDTLFIETVKSVRNKLLALAGTAVEEGFECVIIQGSGTFGVESVISSALGKNDTLLVLANGAYGERIVRMAEIHRINHHVLRFEENELVDPAKTDEFLKSHPEVTHVACVHSETTTGLFNPIHEVGGVCSRHGKVFIVDAMSSFGGVSMDIKADHIHYLVSSANKCVEGVPGFAFALCRRSELEKCKGQARTLVLDLYEQWSGLQKSGQFRFTPPTHSLVAYRQAIAELEQEGGIPAREARYRENKRVLDEGMEKLGFKAYLDPKIQGHIISSFLYPADPKFDFERFYRKLSDRGFIIYPGKLSKTNAFRIGNIGQIFPDDVRGLLGAIAEVIREEGITLP